MTATGATWRNWGRTESVRPGACRAPGQPPTPCSARWPSAARSRAAGQAGRRRAQLHGHRRGAGRAARPHRPVAACIDARCRDGRVTLGAGTHLHQLPALLAPYGLALRTWATSTAQTIAGATSTGHARHGRGFGGLATQIVGAHLVTGTGELAHASARPSNSELLPAARLGLGALGVIVDVTLQLVPRVRAARGREARAARRRARRLAGARARPPTTSSSTGSRTPRPR